MLGIYANSMMIATRTEIQTVVDAPKKNAPRLGLKRFIPRKKKIIDLSRL